MIFKAAKSTLLQLKEIISQLDDSEYTMPIQSLSSSSIGQHSRHIIELFECTIKNYDQNFINYDKRSRNTDIESNTEYAVKSIEHIFDNIIKEDKNIELVHCIDNKICTINTTYYREILYNIEHCIHHQAMIKVALLQLPHINFNENFGVAPSTIEYRKKCAQ